MIARSFITYITGAFIMLMAAACSSEADGPDAPVENGGSYLRVTLVMPAVSRAEIHPDEPALESEDAVSDMTVFFFNGTSGVDGDAATPFFRAVYINGGFTHTDNTLVVNVPLGNNYNYTDNDRIAVVTNMGNLTGLSTLGDLQSYIPDATWQATIQGSPSGCGRFAMTSAYNNDGMLYRNLSVSESEGSDIRYKATVSVERMAARIDLEYDALQENMSYIEYVSTSRDDNSTVDGRVRLYGLSPINAMQLPSFALKRTSYGLSDDYSCFSQWNYAADMPFDGSRPAAYIIEPRTSAKTTTADVPDAWYGGTSSEMMSKGLWNTGLNIETLLQDEKIKFPVDGRRGIVISYLNENTQHYTAHSKKWLTGLMLRAVYVPTTVYADGTATTTADYKPGQTFWIYRANNAQGQQTVLYFISDEAALAYAEAHQSYNAEITSYPSGQCFYHAWLRHIVEEPEPDNDFPMEYGIVRNHIYRISFNFHNVGSPTPDIDEPRSAEAIIFVRPWNIFRHEQIII